jgi:hypothetical protein
MTVDLYKWYADRYNDTKPIRGRAEDVRPIGRRNRDWELLVIEDRADGIWYGALLYRTKVVMCGPNGELELNVDSWPTPKTADFMTKYSPFRASKTQNNIWVSVQGAGNVPILRNTIVKFKLIDGVWQPAEPVKLKQKVVDRKASNAVRATVKGFVDYATTMLKLSDGWVRADTVAQWRTLNEQDGNEWGVWKSYKFDFGFDPEIISILEGVRASRWMKTQPDKYAVHMEKCRAVLKMLSVEDISVWDRAMHCILRKTKEQQCNMVSLIKYMSGQDNQWERTLELCEYQYATDAIRKFVDKLIRELEEVHKVREVEGGCIRDNLVI